MHTDSEAERARAKAKREQALEGARRVFLREGFAAASTDEIAREAGISKRTLYAYYPRKEELFAAVLRFLTIEHPQARVLEFIRGIDPRSPDELREVFLTLARKMLSVMMSDDSLALIRTMIADSHRFPQLGGIVRSTVPERGLQEVGSILQRAQERGLVKPGDPAMMARLFIGPLLSYVVLNGLLAPNHAPQLPDAREIEQMVDLVIGAISWPDPTRR
jgi:TetR/AcrR family transcriptional repressor of mexJK operon